MNFLAEQKKLMIEVKISQKNTMTILQTLETLFHRFARSPLKTENLPACYYET